ncbi:MAG: Diguanylate cyclase/phosphodiesterase [Frankiales bacterium]|nr:Diguanylate cyclase/phosphodiesterase [Frankiales bacterium]
MTSRTSPGRHRPSGPFLSSVPNRYGSDTAGADTQRVPHLPTPRALTAGGAVAVALVAVALFVTGQVDETTDDLLEIASALLAALSCGFAAGASRGRLRLGWAALASACACWTAGEATWSVYELGLHREPFPSPADLGFLLFPVGAAVALLVFPAAATRADRRRMVLDGLMTATAVGLLSWTTALGEVFRHNAGSVAATVISVAYPLSDIALVVLCVLVLSRAKGRRRTLSLIGLGIALMSIADSAFAYTSAVGSETVGGLVDLGWYLAFLALALAPLTSRDKEDRPEEQRQQVAGGYLPYVPLVVCSTVEISRFAMGKAPDVLEAALCGLLMALILVRQALTVRDHQRLATTLLERDRELRHQAFHDGLTGLANRALFVDRTRHALALHARDGRPLSVCFLDLDGFKHVNDTLGHAAGDELLRQVSARFLGALSTADTLARFGGDEFAVLLEDPADALTAAERLRAALEHDFVLDGQPASVTVSIGVATTSPDRSTPTLDELLTMADVAMYTVKRRGKAGVLSYSSDLEATGSVVPRPRIARSPA